MNPTENLGTEDWSDDEIGGDTVAPAGGGEESSTLPVKSDDLHAGDDLHADVAAQLANFDKQFLPSADNEDNQPASERSPL